MARVLHLSLQLGVAMASGHPAHLRLKRGLLNLAFFGRGPVLGGLVVNAGLKISYFFRRCLN